MQMAYTSVFLGDCLQDVFLWMKHSKLKLNADKTEFIFIGTLTQHAKVDGCFPTHILSQSITPAASVLILAVTFDENFNFENMPAVLAGLYHFSLHRNSSSKQQT